MGFGKAGEAEEWDDEWVFMSLTFGVVSCGDLAVVGLKSRRTETEKLLSLEVMAVGPVVTRTGQVTTV